MRGDLRADIGATVQPHPGAAGAAVGGDPAGVRPEPVDGILGGDAALHGGAADPDAVLAQTEIGQRLAGRDPQLRGHQVHIGDFLGHRVLDLNPGIALDEHVVPAFVEQELDGAGAEVADLAGESHRVRADSGPQLVVQVRGRCQLDHLLMAALHTAVPLEQVDHLAGAVGQDLHLDVARIEHRLFEVDHRVAERGLRLPGRGFDGLGQGGGLSHPAHAAATATGDRLDEQRELHICCGSEQFVDQRGRLRRRQHRQPGGPGRRDGAGLVAGQFEHSGVGTDERDPRGGACRCQFRVLREEPITRIHGIGAGQLGHPDDLGHCEVGPNGVARFADLVGLVGLQPMWRIPVLVRVDRDGRDAQLVGRPERPDRDLTAVGNEDFSDCALRQWNAEVGPSTRSGDGSGRSTLPAP